MKRILIIAALLTSQGCSTIMNGASQDVRIVSEPGGAAYTIVGNGETRTGMTPAVERLPAGSGYFSKAEYAVTYSKAGHEDKKTVIKPKVSGWYWVGLVCSAVIGLTVDPLTGGMWKMPEEVNTVLQKE